MPVAIIILYTFFLSFILLYSISQLNNTILYLRAKRRKMQHPKPLEVFPMVTVQLPIYNEKYVIGRLIEAVTKFDYPKEKLEIQVLDDSTDETVELVAKAVKEYRSMGYNIEHVRREDRVDFKAGALKYGLKHSTGEFVVIFDADFVPKPDFLQKTIPYFENEKVGVVQTRWGHINEKYSLLTRLQSFALNAHFTIEQSGRASGSHFINFNGTAGVWRRKTIEDAGGWEGDTLTEDLDLSYRAQLKGWKFQYLEDVVSPAELPAEMNALKSQQFRWAKGAAECSRKNLGKVLRSKSVKFSTKIHAYFHLLNSFVWVCMLCSAILLLPFQYIIRENPQLAQSLNFFILFQLSFFILMFFYLIANFSAKPNTKWWHIFVFILTYPALLTISMGISIYNSIGVIEGYLGVRSPFVRTPKFNIVNSSDSINSKSYVKMKLSITSILEFLGIFYFGYTTYMTIRYENMQALPFTIMMTLGIAAVFILSSYHHMKANRAAS